MKKGSSSFLDEISCVVFDFGFTLCADHYFNYAPPYYPDWQQLCQEIIFKNTALEPIPKKKRVERRDASC